MTTTSFFQLFKKLHICDFPDKNQIKNFELPWANTILKVLHTYVLHFDLDNWPFQMRLGRLFGMWVLHLIKYQLPCFLTEAIWTQIFPRGFWSRKSFFHLPLSICWFIFQNFSSWGSQCHINLERRKKVLSNTGLLLFIPPHPQNTTVFQIFFSWKAVINHY